MFYWIGHNGVAYVLDVFLADTSSLKNRRWIFAFSTSPYIATTFAGPAAASAFYKSTGGWRSAFGTFSAVMPLVCLPLIAIFVHNQRKAVKDGYLAKEASGRTICDSIKHYAIQFDGRCGSVILS